MSIIFAYSESTAKRFDMYVNATLTQLANFPQIGKTMRHLHRRALVTGFPFGIFYAIEGERIFVSAIADLRQDPKVIAKLFGR